MFAEPEVADLVLEILVYTGRRRAQFEVDAAARGITFEQFQAAAIAGALSERLEGASGGGNR